MKLVGIVWKCVVWWFVDDSNNVLPWWPYCWEILYWLRNGASGSEGLGSKLGTGAVSHVWGYFSVPNRISTTLICSTTLEFSWNKNKLYLYYVDGWHSFLIILIFNYFLIPQNKEQFNFPRIEFTSEDLCTEAYARIKSRGSCYCIHCLLSGQFPN